MKRGHLYRPEIDGLRAVAIIPVILFHAGIAGFTGGFVGVDIFFVISGYLITSIILREIGEKRFSLITFWERRMRRILPAVFFIIGAVAIAAYFIILFPSDFIDFGQSLAAQAFFLANIFFMRKSSYFAGPSESMPLLHTWTLSFEEQFYIGFPILVLLVVFLAKRAYRKMIVVVFAALLVLSFLYNIYLIELFSGGGFRLPPFSFIWGEATNANAGFFFILPRAWELLLGALLATGFFTITNRHVGNALSFVGIAGILYAFVAFNGATPFPGYAALLPTVGCALIILSNTHVSTVVGQILAFPVFIWIGLISFSLYLWHWPLIVFSKILFDDAQVYIIPVLFLTFVLSWLTYRFIETPFREKKICSKTWQMYLFGFSAIGILFGAGLLINNRDGLPERAAPAAYPIAEASIDFNPRDRECFRKNFSEIFSEGAPCLLGDQTDNEHIDFVLWGDSHGDATMPIVDIMAGEYGVTGAFFGAGGCRPVIWNHELGIDERCTLVKEQALRYIKKHSVGTILLISSWEENQAAAIAENNPGLIGNQVDGDAIEGDTETFYDALTRTVEEISSDNSEIYIMKRIPILPYNPRRAFTHAARTNEPIDPVTQSLEEYFAQNRSQNSAIDRLGEEGKIIIIDPTSVFCSEGTCSILLNNTIAYRNGTHLNTAGAMLLRPVFEDFFRSLNK